MSVAPFFVSLAFLVAGFAPDRGPAEAPATEAETEVDRFQSALVSTDGLDADAFGSALALRLPDVMLRTAWDLEHDSVGRYVFVHVSRDDTQLVVEVITADGRAFVRSVEQEDDSERLAASFVVSLVSSIEMRETEADRRDVAAPVTHVGAEVERAVIEARGEPQPGEVADAPKGPQEGRQEDPQEDPQTAPVATPTPPATRVLIPQWSVESAAHVGVLLGVAPLGFAHPLAAGGGAVRVLGRSPRDVLAGGELRVLGRATRGHSLVRVRAAALLGHVWSVRNMELAAGGHLGLSGWGIRREGRRIPHADFGAQSLLVHAGGWGLVGRVFVLDRPRLHAVRVGGRLEVGGAFALDGGPRSVALADAQGAELFRVGGLEVTFGLEVSGRFGWPSRTAE